MHTACCQLLLRPGPRKGVEVAEDLLHGEGRRMGGDPTGLQRLHLRLQ